MQIKGAQPACQRVNLARQHRVAALLRAVAALACKNANLQHIADAVSQCLGHVQRTDDQQATCTFEGNRSHWLRVWQVRRRQQGGDFGSGLCTTLAPAAGFTDVDKADNRSRAFSLLGQFDEQASLLGAGDDHVVARHHRLLKSTRLTAAQAAVQAQGFVQGLPQRRQGLGHCQRQGLVAIANQRGHVKYSG